MAAYCPGTGTIKSGSVRDNIEIAEVGDPADIMVALERGRIDGAVLSDAQCKQLQVKGFRRLLDLAPLNVFGAPDAVVALSGFLQEPEQPKAILAAMIEATAFATSDRYEASALAAVKSTLRIEDDNAAKRGLHELAKTMARKPYPSLDRLRNMQRMMAKAKPGVMALRIETLLDDRFVRELDTVGYIDQTFASYAL